MPMVLASEQKNLLRGRVGRLKTNGGGSVLVLQGDMVNQVLTRLQYQGTLLETRLKSSHSSHLSCKNIVKIVPVPSRWMARQERETGAKEKPKKWEEKERKRGRKNGGEEYLLCFLHPKK